MTATVQERLAAFRADRDEIERAVLPLATSLDGRGFSFQASLHGLELQVGGYARLESGDSAWLGQVLSLRLDQREITAGDGVPAQVRYARGEGTILDGPDRPFHDATVRPASPAEVRAWTERIAKPRARLRIGELTFARGLGHELDAAGFDRHSFLCGQSGSGKTYALGRSSSAC